MGLDVSHEAWHGAYSAFTRWREALATAAGYEIGFLATGELFVDEGYGPRPPIGKWVPLRETILIDWGHIERKNYDGDWDVMPSDPLILLIAHSDCDGYIEPWHAGVLANRLEELIPLIPEHQDMGGHVGNVRDKTRTFVDGARAAAKASERLEFG